MVDRKRWRDKRLAERLARIYTRPERRVGYAAVVSALYASGHATSDDVPELRLAAMDAAEREHGK